MSRLIVVSNRVASISEGKAAPGGLAVGILEALSETGGLWVGWNGEQSSAPRTPAIATRGNISSVTFPLSKRDYDQYYRGFSNSTLWPTFHYRIDLSRYSRDDYAGYMRVNALFATQILQILEPDDIIWVHDYHLIPLAEELRRAGVENRIGFFLHIPFPAAQVLATIPPHQELVRSLCAYDLVGFQTASDRDSFERYIVDEVGGKIGPDHRVQAFGRRLVAEVFPIGIHPERLAEQAEKATRTSQYRRVRESVRNRDLIIGVDRLDYSKGVPDRMRAFETLLKTYPGNRGRVTLMQIAPPSRSDVQTYREIRRELESLAGHINGAFADFDWTPIRYLNRGFPRETLMGFFRLAKAGLVTPLRDGMNLVAKEFVAAQDPEDPGVLVLSRFAGAARELDAAVIVNPFDRDGVADAMQRSLAMPLEERRLRWQQMMAKLAENDITRWHTRFLARLAGDPAVPCTTTA